LFISFWTQEMDSTPRPRRCRPPRHDALRCHGDRLQADEQKRFTVIPAVVTGRPARNAIWRAMFRRSRLRDWRSP